MNENVAQISSIIQQHIEAIKNISQNNCYFKNCVNTKTN